MRSTTGTELPERPTLPDTAPDVATVEHAPDGSSLLAEIADLVDARDRLAAQVAVRLATAMDTDLTVTTTRLSTQVWLENVARFPATDAKRLLADVTVLRRLPAVVGGLADGRLSWAQVRRLCAAARTVPVGRFDELDRLIAANLDEYRAYHPDELVDRVWQVCDGWQPSELEKAERAAERGEHLCLQPNLFGGGSLYAEYGTEHFTVVAEALDAPLSAPTLADVDLDDPDAVDAALDEVDRQRRALAREHGAALADRLVRLCEDHLAGTRATGARVAPRPTAYIVTTADALCDRDRTPGWLLHTLTGGAMKASTSLIRDLLDARGADLRGIVLDDLGEVVGVGRRHRVPDHWLREACWARDVTVRSPAGTTAVRRADLDHVISWDDGGRTDVDNLVALDRRFHTAKTRGEWTVERRRDGTLVCTHATSGLTVRRLPRWRPLADPDPPDR